MEVEYQDSFNLILNASIPGWRWFDDNIRFLEYLLGMYIPRSKSSASLATLASEFPCVNFLNFRLKAL
jgi:hypothetical protein